MACRPALKPEMAPLKEVAPTEAVPVFSSQVKVTRAKTPTRTREARSNGATGPATWFAKEASSPAKMAATPELKVIRVKVWFSHSLGYTALLCALTIHDSKDCAGVGTRERAAVVDGSPLASRMAPTEDKMEVAMPTKIRPSMRTWKLLKCLVMQDAM